MAATSPLASLLALSCFALLATTYAANLSLRSNLPNCKEYLAGSASSDVVILDQRLTSPYQELTRIDSKDNCYQKNKRLVGALIVACDPLGPPSPSINALSILSQQVQCHTDGPCPAGLTVSISQYCSG